MATLSAVAASGFIAAGLTTRLAADAAARDAITGAVKGAARDVAYQAGKAGKAAGTAASKLGKTALRKTAELRKGLSADQIKSELSSFKGRAQKVVMDGVNHFKFRRPGGGSAFVTKGPEGIRGPMTAAAYKAHVGARDPFIKSGSGFKQGRLDKAVEAARAGFKKREGLN